MMRAESIRLWWTGCSPDTYPDVTYLGGRQTAPGEWRWVTGPEGKANGGKGTLFWRGDEQGAAPGRPICQLDVIGLSAWRQMGCGPRSAASLIFSYGLPQFSTSLGNGFVEEHVDGYIVEFGGN